MSRCDLFLENYSTCYYAGQQIVGNLRCYFNSPKSVAGIFVKLKGMAVVHWSETESRTDSNNKSTSVSVSYRGEHELINDKIVLLYQHGNKIDVPAGEHIYPFTYTLPLDLPSTYKTTSHIGKITYVIKGYVDIPFKFDYKAETEINIVEILDLNQLPNLLMPVNIEKQKSLGCLCWRSGPIDMSLNIPYTGFVPGQSIPITLEIENLSRTSIEAVKFNIHQMINFYSTSPRRKGRPEANKITSTTDSGVGAHGKRFYELNLQIPSSFAPLNLKKCTIIDVKYTLNVTVVIPGMHRNLNASVDIEIGNVALRDSGYRVQHYPPVLTLAEPEASIIDDVDGFAVIGLNRDPSAPPGMPQEEMPTISVVPVIPSAPPPLSVDQIQPGIGWVNPQDDASKPPSYNDLFEKKN